MLTILAQLPERTSCKLWQVYNQLGIAPSSRLGAKNRKPSAQNWVVECIHNGLSAVRIEVWMLKSLKRVGPLNS